MPRKPAPVFYETQRFPLRRAALALLAPPCVLLGLLIWQVALGHHSTHLSLSDGDVIGWTILLWIIYLRLITARLVTEVRGDDLVIRLPGLWRKRRAHLADIGSVECVTFDPERDYGGYGIRTGHWGKAYIADANQGVQLEMASGATLILGSQRSVELAEILRSKKPGPA